MPASMRAERGNRIGHRPVYRIMRIACCLLFALLLPGVPAAWACSCARIGPGAEMEGARAVFFGRPVLVPTEKPGPWFFGEQDLTYSFAKPWVLKGDEGPLSVGTSSNDAACGRPLEPGRLYLIYAGEVEGKLAIDLCSRTRPWFFAAPDVLYLLTRISLDDWQFLLAAIVLPTVGALWIGQRLVTKL